MKQNLLILFFIFSISTLISQEKNRVQISGLVIVKNNDVEALTVYNMSSNKGTTTDANGAFKIEVALNESIEISALQFIPLKVKISQEVIDTKSIKVYLSEKMNNLDEVLLLPHNLTGDLTVDVENAEVIKPILLSFGSFDDYEMPEDAQSSVENIAINKKELTNGLNITAIIGLIAKALRKDKTKPKATKQELPVLIAQKFPQSYFTDYYNIPKERVSEFLLFLEEKNYKQDLLNPKNELELIEYLSKQSKLFLNQENEKK